MEAMKKQMATMMEAIMSMKKIMQVNAVVVAATSAVVYEYTIKFDDFSSSENKMCIFFFKT